MRLGIFVALPCLGLVGVAYAVPDFAEDCGLDFWNYSTAEQELRECKRVDSQLKAKQEQVHWRNELRSGLVSDLLDGNATIEQTVRHFQELNRNGPVSIDKLRFLYQTDNDRCVAGRQLVAHLDIRTEVDPRCVNVLAEVKSRMRSEFPGEWATVSSKPFPSE
jgi:hypothetical protein